MCLEDLAKRLKPFWFIFQFPFCCEIYFFSSNSNKPLLSSKRLSANLKERNSDISKLDDSKDTSWKLTENRS